MKIIIIALLFSIAGTSAIAQNATMPGPDLQEKAAGYELVKANKQFYTGTIIGWSGGILFIIGAGEIGTGSNNNGAGLLLIGGLGIITGTIFTIESYSHIGRAGKILMQRNDLTFGPNQHGFGAAYHF